MSTIDQLSNNNEDITSTPLEDALQKRAKAGVEASERNYQSLLPDDNVAISDGAKVVSGLLAEPKASNLVRHTKTDGFNLPEHLRLQGAASVGFDLEKHPDREIAWLNYKVLEALANNADIMERAVAEYNGVEQVKS